MPYKDIEKRRVSNKIAARKFRRTEKYKQYLLSDVHKEQKKRYESSEEGKVTRKRYEQKYPERIKAVNLANTWLPKKPCSIPNCYGAGHKHHEDYNKPLDVVYLCEEHHMELHHGNN